MPIDLEPGRYTYELRLDPSAAAEVSPSPGAASASPAPGTSSRRSSWCARRCRPASRQKGGRRRRGVDRRRDGEVAFAVVDTNGEDAGGYRAHESFQLASLSKAILLVASLRDDPTPEPATEATLTTILRSPTTAPPTPSTVRSGSKGMRAVARAAGMQDYEQDGLGGHVRVGMGRGPLVLPARDAGARRGTGSRAAAVLRRHPHPALGHPGGGRTEGWTSYFKGGWLGMDNKLMVQAAWLEKARSGGHSR